MVHCGASVSELYGVFIGNMVVVEYMACLQCIMYNAQ